MPKHATMGDAEATTASRDSDALLPEILQDQRPLQTIFVETQKQPVAPVGFLEMLKKVPLWGWGAGLLVAGVGLLVVFGGDEPQKAKKNPKKKSRVAEVEDEDEEPEGSVSEEQEDEDPEEASEESDDDPETEVENESETSDSSEDEEEPVDDGDDPSDEEEQEVDE